MCQSAWTILNITDPLNCSSSNPAGTPPSLPLSPSSASFINFKFYFKKGNKWATQNCTTTITPSDAKEKFSPLPRMEKCPSVYALRNHPNNFGKEE
jgi:hypothetical protein